MASKHEFALHLAELSKIVARDTVSLHDHEAILRITTILRLQPGEIIILFDKAVHARCRLRSVSKKSLEFELLEKKENTVLLPKATCLLPLLKRDDLETALYAAVELGASVVQLVVTEKVQRAWGGAKEFERLQRIMIAAAEQSKNFALPELHAPIVLEQALENVNKQSAKFKAVKLLFDLGGKSALSVMHELAAEKHAEIILLVGPEGDLTDIEKQLAAQQGFVTCTLTPTILRAVSAFALGLGLIRSCLPRSS